MRAPSGDSRPGRARLAVWHVCIVAVVFAIWYALTTPGIVDEAYANKIAFFFGRPLEVIKVVVAWFTSGKIYVVSSRGVPNRNASVKVHGYVEPGVNVMGRSLGTAIKESGHKVHY